MKAIARHYMPHLLIIAMMATTSIAISLTGAVAIAESDIINRTLPDRIGTYEGGNILFCQNESCLKSHTEESLDGSSACTECGGHLKHASLAELSSFPEDTTLARKIYETPNGDQFWVTIVVAGRDRTGIHRPQYCLPAQGQNILKHRVFPVPVTDEQGIRINILDLQSTSPGHAVLRGPTSSTYAYFYAANRTTPSYLRMIYWTSYDRIIHGTSTPWAYISIATARRDNSDEHIERIVNFTSLLCQEMDIHPHNTGQSKSSGH